MASDIDRQRTLDLLAAAVSEEFTRAVDTYPPMNSPHEGFAVLLEEVDELWDEVKRKPAVRSNAAMRLEAIQVAAMALRFAFDCT